MAWYVYKCDSRKGPRQNQFGDWRNFFEATQDGGERRWGTPDTAPDLERLTPGDEVLAYQTDRHRLVGLAQVRRWGEEKGRRCVYLRPRLWLGAEGVDMRPLKADGRIAAVPAFKTREIRTLYDIDADEARYLLDVARNHCYAINYRNADTDEAHPT